MRLVAERLAGKGAVVTGGSRGIGAGIVAALLAEGATVVTCGRGAKPETLPGNVTWVTADVASDGDVCRLRDRAVAVLGRIDVLVNNAGVLNGGTVSETTDSDFDLLMGVNVKGLFQCCRAFIPIMREHGGAIVNMGSTSGFAADPGMAVYNASKAFVHGLTRAIAVDHGPDGIRCNAVCPGWIVTGMLEASFGPARDTAAAQQDAIRRHPAGRLGRPEDVAAMVVHLASDEARFLTGQTFIVDGGLIASTPIRPEFF
jgi:meso-butanediol dehydrogenase/(S,S)-butanediol dehydrogenase/diacetyl reductase